MTHIHCFQMNIPKDNHSYGWTDGYLNIIARWNTEQFYNDGTPMVFIDLINPSIHTCTSVKDWREMERQIDKVAREHFKELARVERINKARAELIAQGEIIENPILARYESNEVKMVDTMFTSENC